MKRKLFSEVSDVDDLREGDILYLPPEPGRRKIRLTRKTLMRKGLTMCHTVFAQNTSPFASGNAGKSFFLVARFVSKTAAKRVISNIIPKTKPREYTITGAQFAPVSAVLHANRDYKISLQDVFLARKPFFACFRTPSYALHSWDHESSLRMIAEGDDIPRWLPELMYTGDLPHPLHQASADTVYGRMVKSIADQTDDMLRLRFHGTKEFIEFMTACGAKIFRPTSGKAMQMLAIRSLDQAMRDNGGLQALDGSVHRMERAISILKRDLALARRRCRWWHALVKNTPVADDAFLETQIKELQ